MNDIAFVSLSDIAEEDLVALMNNAEVGKQMPLLAGGFSRDTCHAFLDAKRRMWEEHGYGPWAFLIGGEFAGWGGLQPEQGETDFALVLDPRFWGWGRKIFAKVRERAFGEMGLDSFTILFPPSRLNAKAITRIGFVEEDSVMVDGVAFVRYRLTRPFDCCDATCQSPHGKSGRETHITARTAARGGRRARASISGRHQ